MINQENVSWVETINILMKEMIAQDENQDKVKLRLNIIEKLTLSCCHFYVAVAEEGIYITFGKKPDRSKADSILLMVMKGMSALNWYCAEYCLEPLFKVVSNDSASDFARQMYHELIAMRNQES